MAKGIQTHPLFKLGKLPATIDRRTFRLASLLKEPPPAPTQFDFDLLHPDIPTPMFGNDTYGDCVIAARAHLTLRFEETERNTLLEITDPEVLKEYFKETGGPDSGLNLLDSLNEWRQQGWSVGGKRYNIHAFAQIDPGKPPEVRAAIYLLTAAYIGLALPLSAQYQVQAGVPWEVTTGSKAVPNSWGGHCVTIPGYTAFGPVCVTWGRKQQMSWAFFTKYCDEAYAIVDERDAVDEIPGIDVTKLTDYLESLNGKAEPRKPAPRRKRAPAKTGA